ncbi:MAG: thioredoxin family protein [Flavobacteriaceae bacterium]
MMYLKKYFLLIFLLGIGIFSAFTQERNLRVTDANGREKLLGIIDEQGLRSASFANWFNTQYDHYKVDNSTIKAVSGTLEAYTIKAFMGTWCGDSKREVPRLYKILRAANFPMDQLTMVAVDYIKPNYKKSPTGEEKGLNIVKVPTFIFFKNGKEVNRIIEFPVTSLEKDISAIVNGKNYVPNYSDIPVLPVD